MNRQEFEAFFEQQTDCLLDRWARSRWSFRIAVGFVAVLILAHLLLSCAG